MQGYGVDIQGENTMASPVTRTLLRTLRHLEKEIAEKAAGKSTTRQPKSRQGKKALVCHAEPALAWQLKKLALDRDVTVQALLVESLGDLFEKYHLPRCP